MINRGDRKEDIYLDDKDRLCFIDTLAQACEKTGWQVHAFCLMPEASASFQLLASRPFGNPARDGTPNRMPVPSPFSFSIFRRHGRGGGEQEATAAQRAARHRAAQERQDRVRRALKQLDRLRAEVAKGSAKTTQRVSCTEPEARVMKQPRQNGPGRTVTRAQEPPAVMRFRARMKTRDAQEVYRTRSQVAEFPHAWIKDKFGLRRFRLRGLVKTGLEALWACLTYNIQQWIRLAWAVRLSSAA